MSAEATQEKHDVVATQGEVALSKQSLVLLYNAVSLAQNGGFYTSLSFEEQANILATLIAIRPVLTAPTDQKK